MKRRGNESIILTTTAGPRLRCFLDKACFVIAACIAASGILLAQVEPTGPIHLWRLHGYFVNATGSPLANVQVTLQRNGQVFYRTRTDRTGRFAFDHVSGRYILHIDRSKYSEVSRDVIVGIEVATMLRSNTLYVIAGPGACTDDCSSVFTSKTKFDRATSRNAREYHQEDVEKNATQK